jgi:hypothetical protein
VLLGVVRVMPAGGLGGADCEQLRDSLIAQPVAAASSVAYVVAGILLAWTWRDPMGGERRLAALYAGLLVLVGVGSIAYHGPQGPGAQTLHDLPIVGLGALAVGVPLLRWLRGRPALEPGVRRPLLVAGVAGALAVMAYATGRTTSPLCDPTSLAQGHALWHVASAAALAAWGWMLWPGSAEALAGRTGRRRPAPSARLAYARLRAGARSPGRRP